MLAKRWRRASDISEDDGGRAENLSKTRLWRESVVYARMQILIVLRQFAALAKQRQLMPPVVGRFLDEEPPQWPAICRAPFHPPPVRNLPRKIQHFPST